MIRRLILPYIVVIHVDPVILQMPASRIGSGPAAVGGEDDSSSD